MESTSQVVHLPDMPHNGSSAEVPEQVSLDSAMEFSVAKIKLESLVKDWENIREKAKENRKTRDVECSVETLRRDGTLDEDETLIPIRTIDTNITREQPPYINYIKNSRRLCIFTCLDNPDVDSDKIELEFTRGMTYLGWENEHFKTVDGAATHGWDTIEVVFDSSKPLNVGIEHVGFDNLFWPKTSRNIQQAPRVIRGYDYSIIELKSFVEKYGWNGTQVNLIIQARKSGKKEGETCRVYKTMFKEEGVVNVAWFALGDGCSDWLKAPSPLYLGIDKQQQSVDPLTGQPTQSWQPAAVTEYPYFVLPYRESEKPKLIDKHGRVFLDANKQEAQTAILSGFVNGLNRAVKIIASPKQDDGSGNSVKEIADQPLEGGTILSKPMDFYNSPYPDFQILKTLQWLDVSNSQETNQTNFAVMNREDSRKTAKEMSLAEQQSNLLNSVQLTLFSAHIRGIYSLAWLIVQSQALQNNIKFLLVNQPQPVINPVTNQPVIDQQSGQPITKPNWVNNSEIVGLKYDVRAAGDVDVIQRNELIQQMKQDWSVVQGTGLAQQFLSDLIVLSYPNKGEAYAKVLADGNANQVQSLSQLVAGLTTTLEGFATQHPESVQSLPPDKQAQLGQMLEAGQQIVRQGQQKGKK